MVTAKVTPWRCIQSGTEYPIAESNAEGGHSVPTQQNDLQTRRERVFFYWRWWPNACCCGAFSGFFTD